jgi:hypothetical protein
VTSASRASPGNAGRRARELDQEAGAAERSERVVTSVASIDIESS